MRSSTVLILSLKTVAHEIIKNLVLAGIGRLIVMDNGVVTEEDLGSGFLFREEEGAVGQEVCPFLLFSSSLHLAHSVYLPIFFSNLWLCNMTWRKRTNNIENDSSNTSNTITKSPSLLDSLTNIITIRPRSAER